MTNPDADQQRAFALEVVQKLRDSGFEALWAGGCVRDQLLGMTPKDYDVATNATPPQVRELFGRRSTVAVGAAFGVIAVLGGRKRGQIEVVTFRTDSDYSDGRHPDQVTFASAEEDAQRRDFTINGLFFDPLSETIIDYVGGRADLESRSIRAIGDPIQRITEDKLRMLRAVRFAASYAFLIESDTWHAIQSMAQEVDAVSAERIGMEIRRMLLGANRAHAIRLLREALLLESVLPEVAEQSPPQWDESQRVLGALENPDLPVAWAALVHSHANLGQVRAMGRRLRFTNKETDRVQWLLTSLPVVAHATSARWSRLQPILGHEAATQVVELWEAVAGRGNSSALLCRQHLDLPHDVLNPPPLLTGAELIARGYNPGPQFSQILTAVRHAQLDGVIATTSEAVDLVDQLTNEAGLE